MVTECKMVRDAVPLLLPVSEGRLPGGLPLVAGLRPAEHPHCLPAHLRQNVDFMGSSQIACTVFLNC